MRGVAFPRLDLEHAVYGDLGVRNELGLLRSGVAFGGDDDVHPVSGIIRLLVDAPFENGRRRRPGKGGAGKNGKRKDETIERVHEKVRGALVVMQKLNEGKAVGGSYV
ncbi:MAG: hypothetical protein IPP19_10455 [Verrucomicrobia bacterium]|nr:hypothetical protein [Verrucomicrobiota bacterium]